MDPSVEFGLRFESSEEEDSNDEPAVFSSEDDNIKKVDTETGQIVSLDSFRK